MFIVSHCWYFFPTPSLLFTEQEKVDVAQKRDVEGMGIPEIKYGESMCFVQHVSAGLWLTYAALDAKAARLGMMKRKVWVNAQLNKNNCNETAIYDRENKEIWSVRQ